MKVFNIIAKKINNIKVKCVDTISFNIITSGFPKATFLSAIIKIIFSLNTSIKERKKMLSTIDINNVFILDNKNQSNTLITMFMSNVIKTILFTVTTSLDIMIKILSVIKIKIEFIGKLLENLKSQTTIDMNFSGSATCLIGRYRILAETDPYTLGTFDPEDLLNVDYIID